MTKTTHPNRRRTTLRRAAQAASLSIFLLAACAHNHPPDLTIDPDAPFHGPPITTAVRAGNHTIAVDLPSAGWQVLGDEVLRHHRDNKVFLTLVRPDPELMHAQVVTRFDVTPGVRADEPVAIYMRVVDFAADPDTTPFRLAQTIAPVRD